VDTGEFKRGNQGKKPRNNNRGQASHGEQQRSLEMFPDFNRPERPTSP